MSYVFPEYEVKTREIFKTADEAVEHLIADGFVKTGYDPLFPWEKTFEGGHVMRARGGYDHNREHYFIEGLRC